MMGPGAGAADGEKFLRKGILESSPDGSGVEYVDDAEEEDEVDASLDSDPSELSDVSEPVLESAGCVFSMSPKCFSASLTASSCGTPANATTIRSGW